MDGFVEVIEYSCVNVRGSACGDRLGPGTTTPPGHGSRRRHRGESHPILVVQ
ncbi:hypothetical protein HMPREF1979_00688 [Actinomyces johnsonii F0542]|uniref:Uncharacterized protein n=1 Tax=Actinomyces johnsonii F0542 TaxID=1321818 RepID=U1RZW4_9ACTO|nr:hypothetical protein HMPREF1979_00688 [Actinomyces johnsonii F0542]